MGRAPSRGGRAEEREALWEARLARSTMGAAVLHCRENGQILGALQLLDNISEQKNTLRTTKRPQQNQKAQCEVPKKQTLFSPKP